MPGTTPLEIFDLLSELVAVPSVSHDAAACARVLEVIEAAVGGGLYLERVLDNGVRSLVYATHPGPVHDVILNAHVDVVPARDAQFHVRRSGHRAEGRGTYDMKGAAAVYIGLLRDLAARPESARPNLSVQFVTDEEIGGKHGARVLLQKGFRGNVFIAGEPTNLDVCCRAKGIVWVTVRCDGSPGHAAMPWQSSSPIQPLLAGLARLQQRWPHPTAELWRTTATVTGLRAGQAHNRVPESAEVDLDVRRTPDESVQDVLEFVRSAFDPCELDVKQIGAALETTEDNPWIERLCATQQNLIGQRPRLYGEHFGSDARYYSEAGIPAFCWGPRGGGMHADDEWVDLQSLQEYDRILRSLLDGGPVRDM